MKVIAKIPGENKEILDKFLKMGENARLVKGCVLIELKNSDEDKNLFMLPKDVGNMLLLIDLCETGGQRGNKGEAQIVCGLSGKTLKPYFVPKKFMKGNEEHAKFSVPTAVITVNAIKDETIIISKYTISKGDTVVRLQKDILWEGMFDSNPPDTLQNYLGPVEAARQKATCPNCREPHYISFEDLRREN